MAKFKKILLGIDLNHFSQEAMEFAAETADLYHSKLIVLYAHKSFLPLVNVTLPKGTVLKDIKEHKKNLIALCKQYIPKSVNWEAVVIEGRPTYLTVIRAAEKLQSDLIIVGEYDRHHLDEILLGSNTEKIVRYAPCSVFVLRKKKT